MSIRAERKLQSQHTMLETILALGLSGQSFSNISLRQLAREMGTVPSALYRYFPNKDALAHALIDHVAWVIKSDINLMVNCFTHISSEIALRTFLQQVEQKSGYWHFFIRERWGGFALLQTKIEHEMGDLTHHLAQRLKRQPIVMQQFPHQAHILAAILLPLFFSWIMQWLIEQNANKTTRHILFIQFNTQINLLKTQALKS